MKIDSPVMNNIGTAYFTLEQRETAKGHLEKAHGVFKKSFGDDHPHTKAVTKTLGICLRA